MVEEKEIRATSPMDLSRRIQVLKQSQMKSKKAMFTEIPLWLFQAVKSAIWTAVQNRVGMTAKTLEAFTAEES